MKLKQLFQLIWKHKEWLFSGIGITIITFIYTSYTENKNSNGIDIQGDVNGNIYQNSTINNIVEEKNTQEVIMSESKYLEYLKTKVKEDIIYSYYNDYDGNGSCEMFALIGEIATDTGLGGGEDLYGKIWFVNEQGAMEVESDDIEYWTSPHVFNVGGNIFIAFEKAYTTGSQTFIWGVREEKPYQPNISGKVHGLVNVNEYDEIEATHSTYDISYDKSLGFEIGHTWKKYYFYFDGSTFKEYGGINISIDDILKIPIGKKIINKVYKHSFDVDSIYYRSNNIININISKENDESIEYKNITLRYINKEWEIVSPDEFGYNYGEGYYLKAFIPSIATYPEKFAY